MMESASGESALEDDYNGGVENQDTDDSNQPSAAMMMGGGISETGSQKWSRKPRNSRELPQVGGGGATSGGAGGPYLFESLLTQGKTKIVDRINSVVVVPVNQSSTVDVDVSVNSSLPFVASC